MSKFFSAILTATLVVLAFTVLFQMLEMKEYNLFETIYNTYFK